MATGALGWSGILERGGELIGQCVCVLLRMRIGLSWAREIEMTTDDGRREGYGPEVFLVIQLSLPHVAHDSSRGAMSDPLVFENPPKTTGGRGHGKRNLVKPRERWFRAGRALASPSQLPSPEPR